MKNLINLKSYLTKLRGLRASVGENTVMCSESPANHILITYESPKNHLRFITAFLLLLCLSVGQMWAETIKEDFEKQTAGNTYNSTQTYTAVNSNAGIAWFVEHGTVSTSSYLDGTKSMHMRAYYAKRSASNVWNGNLPYVNSTTNVQGLVSITFDAAVSNTYLKLDVMYSTNNGTTWSYMKQTSASGSDWNNVALTTTSKKNYSAYIPTAAISPTANYRIKIAVNSGVTHANKPGSNGNYTFRVDDIVFTYTAAATTYTVSYANGGGTGTAPASHTGITSGSSITLKANTYIAPAGKQFAGWNDGTSTYAAGASYTVTGNKTMTAQWSCITPTISVHPSNGSCVQGGSPSPLTVTASGGTLSYQWKQCATSGGTYTNVSGGSGGTTASYTPPVTTPGTMYYKCVVTNTGSSCNTTATSNYASFTVTASGCTTSPTVTAGSYSAVTSTTATVACTSGISSLGSAGCTITSYGFVIGTSTNPAIGGSGVTKHEVGTTYTTTGTSFNKALTGLTASTTYYVRPYATNGNGTSYGTQTTFITADAPNITVSETAWAFGDRKVSGGPYTMTFTVSGTNLTGNITLAKSGTNAAMFSIDKTSLTQSAGSVSTTTITVSYSPTAAGSHTALITISSAGATSKTVNLTGTGKWEVTWNNNGSTSTSLVANGTKPTFPSTQESCDATSTTFIGWATAAWSGKIANLTGKTVHTSNSTMSNITANGTTFYAVFAKATAASSTKTYSFSITSSYFNSTSYAANNNEKTTTATATDASGATIDVKWTSNQVMLQSSAMQWQKNAGYIYNSTDLGTVNSVVVTSTAGTYTTYYGTTSQPSSGAQGSGKGYFKTSVGNATGTATTLTVNFTKTTSGGTTYSDYLTTCVACTADPTIAQPAAPSGDVTLTSVPVSVTGMSAGSDCSWQDCGFVWGTSGSPTVSDHKVQVGTSGNATSYNETLTGPFTVGITYYVKAYGKNNKADADFKYGSNRSFIIRSITFNSNGGSAVATQYVLNNSKATQPANPTKAGKIFGGWYSNSALTTDVDWNATINANKTYYAKWNDPPTDHFIDEIQGTVVADKTTTYDISTITIADKAAATTGTCNEVHYHFVGWITKAKYDAGTAIAAGDIQTGSKTPDNTTYYAVWAKEGAESTTTFKRVQTLSDLNSASMIAIVNAFSSSHYIMTTNLATAQTAPTESAGKITVSSGKYWTLEKDGNNWRFKTGSNYLKADYLPAVAKDKKTISTSSGTSGYSSWEILNNSYTSNGTPVFTIKNAAGAYAGLEYSSGWCTYYATDFNTSWYTLQLYVPTRDFSDYVASCGATYDIVLNKNGGTTNGSATVTENYAALNSGFTEPVWAGHMVDYYMVAAASGSTKIAEADGTFAKSVTVSGTPWTDANGKWVKGSGATFYAKWEARQCVITLNHAGADTGHEGTANVTATYGANTNLTTSITKPEKTGYTFGGYYTEENGAGTQLIDANGAWLDSKTGYTNGIKQWQLDAATLVLYAKWTIETYTVTWYVNGVAVATETSVPYGRLYSNLSNEPDVANNALSSCGSNKFIGWVTADGQYTANGGTKTEQYDPYAVTGSTTIAPDRKDFYAMFATESGSAFTLDGANGSAQSCKIYCTISGVNYYATGTANASGYSGTTDPTEANTFTFTKVSDGIYTIKHGTKYVVQYSAGSTKLDEKGASFNWQISTPGSNGTWRVKCKTNDEARAIIGFKNRGSDSFGDFKTYATSNTVGGNSDMYYDVELGSSTLTDYRTGCCSEKITLTVTGATNGTVAMTFNNASVSSGANVSTCATSTLVVKVTANAGYTLTNMSISGVTGITIDPSPLTTGLPTTAEKTYTVSIPALKTGTLTITPTFTQTYSVTYDLGGGETAGSTATARYTSGTSVTLATPDPTRTGYNFTGWTINKAGGGTVTPSAGAFTMPSTNVTVVAGWSAKPLTSLTVDPTTATVYVGQYVQIPITYDPADILTKGYTLVSTPAYCITTGSTNTTLKITGGRGGVTITEDKVETVSIKADADNTKTASVTVTVKPLPVDHFRDLIHGETFADQTASIVANALSANYSAPGHEDVDEPVSGNTCEKEHLHLVGWIESEWANAHLTATMSEIKAAKDADNKPLFHAVYSAMTASNKTYYAVWGHEVTP